MMQLATIKNQRCYNLVVNNTNMTYLPHWVDNFHHNLPQGSTDH